MKIIKRLAVLLVTLAALLPLAIAEAEPAEDISSCCTYTQDGKKLKSKDMLDRRYSTYVSISKGRSLIIESADETISGLFLQFYERPTTVTIQAEQNGEWVDVAEGGTHLSDWYALPDRTTRARIVNTDKARLQLAELTVCGPGERPGYAASWQDCDKADMLLLVGHPDDELLWFGGLLPTYAGERQLKVQVVYAVKSIPQRRLELLDGLWHCGVNVYPMFLGQRDTRTNSLNAMYQVWDKYGIYTSVTRIIRMVRP